MKNYKWTMLSHATFFPVKDGKKIVIPCNANGVEVAFGQSSKPLVDKFGKQTGRMQNVYRWNGVVYNS